MKIKTDFISFKTKGNCDIVDITDEVQRIIDNSGIAEGSVLVFAVGSTAGITTIEHEPGLMKDYPAFFERIIPSKINYNHDNTWHDGNGHSHVRASIQGCSLTIPFVDKKLLTGTWQQIIFVDFDNRSRNRKVVVQVTGI
ncbi:MAG TPA: secondary thiamine-phosphate synthase enzyme YjbQ [Ignavibacteriaceae bacterium]|nr:secondary thiamine-phosphate synthase enzyme YjbQ [Ignavibacteriaceae bacterium]